MKRATWADCDSSHQNIWVGTLFWVSRRQQEKLKPRCNIVSACATCGTIGAEGRLMRSDAIPCLIYAALTILILGGLILAGFNPIA